MTTITITQWMDAAATAGWPHVGLHTAALAGTTPTFVLSSTVLTTARRMLVWGTDLEGDTWHDFDNIVESPDNTFSLSNDDPFPAGDIYVLQYPAYTYHRAVRKVAEWLAGSYCTDTASGTSGVLGASTARADGNYGRTVPALGYLGFKLTGPAGNTKNKAVLVAGVHAQETPGNWVLEGAVDFLLSDDAAAVQLRAWFEFYVYPLISAQGRWAGYERAQPQNSAFNANRKWATPGALENVDAYKTYITADTGGGIAVGLDFHTGDATGADSVLSVNDVTAIKLPEFLAAMQDLEAGYTLFDRGDPEGLVADFLATLDSGGSLRVCGSSEVQHAVSLAAPASWLTHGANVMRALGAMLAAGDFANGPG